MSDYLLEDKENEQQVFELLFKIYYSQYDFITLQISTYLKPTKNDSVLGPQKKKSDCCENTQKEHSR